MRIAVAFDQGNVFQHFGHTEQFKVYETEQGLVTGCTIISANGKGHDALTGLLAGEKIDVVICGGIGGSAMNALAEAGIEIVAGVDGSADDAVGSYLKGELTSTGVNCHHHENEGECSCGGDCGCGSEGGCGGCGGGCGGCRAESSLTGKNVNKTLKVHYRGTFNDGTQFDSSYDRGEPLEFVCGAGMMIRGFDAAVADMDVGDVVDIHLQPEEAYGPLNPDMIFTVAIAQLPGSETLAVGQRVYLANQYGQPFPVTVTAKDETMITLDANHEMAGKELNFRIELVEVC